MELNNSDRHQHDFFPVTPNNPNNMNNFTHNSHNPQTRSFTASGTGPRMRQNCGNHLNSNNPNNLNNHNSFGTNNNLNNTWIPSPPPPPTLNETARLSVKDADNMSDDDIEMIEEMRGCNNRSNRNKKNLNAKDTSVESLGSSLNASLVAPRPYKRRGKLAASAVMPPVSSDPIKCVMHLPLLCNTSFATLEQVNEVNKFIDSVMNEQRDVSAGILDKYDVDDLHFGTDWEFTLCAEETEGNGVGTIVDWIDCVIESIDVDDAYLCKRLVEFQKQARKEAHAMQYHWKDWILPTSRQHYSKTRLHKRRMR